MHRGRTATTCMLGLSPPVGLFSRSTRLLDELHTLLDDIGTIWLWRLVHAVPPARGIRRMRSRLPLASLSSSFTPTAALGGGMARITDSYTHAGACALPGGGGRVCGPRSVALLSEVVSVSSILLSSSVMWLRKLAAASSGHGHTSRALARGLVYRYLGSAATAHEGSSISMAGEGRPGAVLHHHHQHVRETQGQLFRRLLHQQPTAGGQAGKSRGGRRGGSKGPACLPACSSCVKEEEGCGG